jgi:hypothetical protein
MSFYRQAAQMDFSRYLLIYCVGKNRDTTVGVPLTVPSGASLASDHLPPLFDYKTFPLSQ